jgi:hypothetical protein
VSEPTPDSEALATAKGLTGALEAIGEKIEGLTGAVATSRHMIIALAVSLCIDVALTIVVAVFAVQAHDASDSAVAARLTAAVAARDNRALCLSGNVARAEQIEPWEDLLALSKPPKTAAQKRLVDEFVAKLHKIYEPRDCSHISPGAP